MATTAGSTPSLQSFLQQCAARVEARLQAALTGAAPGAELLQEAMRYAALGPGKRLRPALVYASAAAITTGDTRPALCDDAAAALECIHAYSLVHDDLPAMDDDDLRRGRPTCHIQFDEATAILAGDALQTRAFELLLQSDAEPRLKLSLLTELARASGAEGMVAGQAIDLAAVNRQPDLSRLETMHRLKTGALIRASARMGALAADATSQQLDAVSGYAGAIGLAFQVQDDILDVTADTATLGKTQGADAARNKPTYVSLLGLEGARDKLAALHREALEYLDPLQGDCRLLQQLADYIVERGH
ncbi:polyprenyl synthetase family protein [Microbulbifer yueqingensis]|uniref:Farnesyl-diphosphate synthase n=1 Tax=Microbulbifer yueqingensis TaxID=658219 RepID=A0A1G8XXR9_9GAMM|nr:farnesyl diphosphate synthase [Microbulbifer yueqingensis]SDJ95372.1 farnesyl-diphosphate synthase [Microbulbifer yueqingensis]